jgi:hypothetical protein
VRPHDLCHQGQSEPGSFHVVHQTRLKAHEFLENPFLILTGDPDPTVGHTDPDVLIPDPGRHRDVLALS